MIRKRLALAVVTVAFLGLIAIPIPPPGNFPPHPMDQFQYDTCGLMGGNNCPVRHCVFKCSMDKYTYHHMSYYDTDRSGDFTSRDRVIRTWDTKFFPAGTAVH